MAFLSSSSSFTFARFLISRSTSWNSSSETFLLGFSYCEMEGSKTPIDLVDFLLRLLEAAFSAVASNKFVCFLDLRGLFYFLSLSPAAPKRSAAFLDFLLRVALFFYTPATSMESRDPEFFFLLCLFFGARVWLPLGVSKIARFFFLLRFGIGLA